MCEVPKINLTDPISSGPWTLYFHQGDSDKWSLDSFVKINTCVTWGDVLQTIEEVGPLRFKSGQPFFMRGDILPLWENHQNIRGGSYSVKVPSELVKEVFTTQVLQAMLGLAFKESGNVCMGISMSPKKRNIQYLENLEFECREIQYIRWPLFSRFSLFRL